MQQQNMMQPPAPPGRATAGFAFSLVGALIILAQGVVRIFRGEAIAFLSSDELRRRVLAGLAWQVVGLFAVIFAILILIGAYFMYSPGKETLGGIFVLVFAALSIVTGGGWLIGFILAITGGILGLLKK